MIISHQGVGVLKYSYRNMAKLKAPLLSLDASGPLARAISFVRRRGVNIAEKKPEILDVASGPQLAWRHMFNKCVDLWHTLSADEQAEWESAARSRHMTGYAWYISQCLRPNPGIYLPLQGGTMSGDIDMNGHGITDLPAPTNPNDAATKAYASAPGTTQTKGASVYHDANQAIPHNASTILAFNSERYDTDTIHDVAVSNSRLTCKSPGKYLILFDGRFQANAVGFRGWRLKVNGILYVALNYHAIREENTYGSTIARIMDMALNDYVEVEVYQNTGAPLNIERQVAFSPEFMMQRIG